jgi:hypothetical protein
MGACLNIWQKASKIFSLKEELEENAISDEDALQLAYEEMKQAQNWFANVNDPELVDYAIYKMKAAEKHYDYLIKKIKDNQD